MPRVSVAVEHNVDPALVKAHAARLIEAKLQEVTEVQGFQMQWSGDVGTFQIKVHGVSVRGVVDIQPKQIVVSVHLPLIAAMFKGRVREGITKGITQALGGSDP